MVQRHALQAIAHNLLGAFLSRNNDLQGYWAVGKLFAFALEKQQPALVWDLLAEPASADFPLLAAPYAAHLRAALQTAGIQPESLHTARLELHFRHLDPVLLQKSDQRGMHPFEGVCALGAKRPRVYVARRLDFCAVHNPHFEMQSVRS
ncbi:MAG: hypothetical protein ACO1RX_14790 [Candidatus Sericytochromatia bacterium]